MALQLQSSSLPGIVRVFDVPLTVLDEDEDLNPLFPRTDSCRNVEQIHTSDTQILVSKTAERTECINLTPRQQRDLLAVPPMQKQERRDAIWRIQERRFQQLEQLSRFQSEHRTEERNTEQNLNRAWQKKIQEMKELLATRRRLPTPINPASSCQSQRRRRRRRRHIYPVRTQGGRRRHRGSRSCPTPGVTAGPVVSRVPSLPYLLSGGGRLAYQGQALWRRQRLRDRQPVNPEGLRPMLVGLLRRQGFNVK